MTPCTELTIEEKEQMGDARVGLTLCSPLISYMFLRTDCFITEDEIPYNTACAGFNEDTGKFFVAIHREFWNRLPNTLQRTFVLMHETLHVFLGHSERRIDMNYDPDLWNKAADYYINLTGMGFAKNSYGGVKQAERYEKYVEVPKWVLFRERFIGMSTDEIYHYLKENPNENPKKEAMDDVSNFTIGKGSSKAESTRKEVLNGAIAFSSSTGIGDANGDLLQEIKNQAEVKIDWTQRLMVEAAAFGSDNITYNRISKRGDGSVIYPRYEGEHVSLVFGFDSSGSMTATDYMEVAGALDGVLEQFDSWEVILVSCDTVAREIGRFTSEDGDEISTMDLTAYGLGGTDLKSIPEYTDNLILDGEEISSLIIATDGHIPLNIDHYFNNTIKNFMVVTRNGNKSLNLSACDVIHVE